MEFRQRPDGEFEIHFKGESLRQISQVKIGLSYLIAEDKIVYSEEDGQILRTYLPDADQQTYDYLENCSLHAQYAEPIGEPVRVNPKYL